MCQPKKWSGVFSVQVYAKKGTDTISGYLFLCGEDYPRGWYCNALDGSVRYSERLPDDFFDAMNRAGVDHDSITDYQITQTGNDFFRVLNAYCSSFLKKDKKNPHALKPIFEILRDQAVSLALQQNIVSITNNFLPDSERIALSNINCQVSWVHYKLKL